MMFGWLTRKPPARRVLVSFCNLRETAATALHVAQLDTGILTPLSLDGTNRYPVISGLGISLNDAFIFHVFDNLDGTRVAILRRDNFAPVLCQQIHEVLQPHSILADGQHLYVVSAGTDEVVRYDWTPAAIANPAVVWKASDTGTDTHHLNSIARHGKSLLCSGFGPKAGDLWSSAADGYIYDLTRGAYVRRGIYHPHSILSRQRQLYFVESSRSALCSLDAAIATFEGYVRGLTFISRSRVVVGSSVGRTTSKSQGIVLNPADPGAPRGACALTVYDLASREIIRRIDLSQHANEVYDIAAI